jgi:RimJ/RimL family protein N-acetyltransferase
MKDLFDSFPFLSNGEITLRKISISDLNDVISMFTCEEVYRYVPTYVPEKLCGGDMEYFISHKCDELFDSKEEIVLGIYYRGRFCGIYELYHYDASKNKVSVGIRLNKPFWNQQISQACFLLIKEYLFSQTTITTICASCMVENITAHSSLDRNGFSLVTENVLEDWGFEHRVYVDKWILK